MYDWVPRAGLCQKDWNADETDENNADKNGSKSVKNENDPPSSAFKSA